MYRDDFCIDQQHLELPGFVVALFLLDNAAGNELWLWQGWWPDRQGEETEGCDARGSGAVRWQAERRAAMQTCLDYWQSQHEDKDTPVAYLVWAGLEPLHFTNLFPIWTDRDDIAELSIRVRIPLYRYKIKR